MHVCYAVGVTEDVVELRCCRKRGHKGAHYDKVRLCFWVAPPWACWARVTGDGLQVFHG